MNDLKDIHVLILTNSFGQAEIFTVKSGFQIFYAF